MSGSKDNNEDLKKLEDEAYFELCQIIAEALEYQDVELLDARIAAWKTKYKKLLDRPSTNSKSDFKKRIEYLLNQYYSSVTQYILNQLKLHEVKKVEKQAKAMRELYRTIKDTNDYDLLTRKIKKWEEKYPIDGFLAMYQKRIKMLTREKNIRENSFKQEEAFSDLVAVTKKTGTIDELKYELKRWEDKYSINDKFTIDDFIKHETEVKRYTSDEFLQSIAREDTKPENPNQMIVDYTDKGFSDMALQANAYATLDTIAKSPNNVNEVFRWVYQNRNIKFNDKYKELILNTTYLNYSPTYLNKLPKPKLDMANSALSFEEYQNIDDIKRYAIISYFNLLLPPEKAVANDDFNRCVYTIYSKTEQARIAPKMEEPFLHIDNSIIEDNTPQAVPEPISKEQFDYTCVVALSPLFILAVNDWDKQAKIIDSIDSDVTKQVDMERQETIQKDNFIRTNNNVE